VRSEDVIAIHLEKLDAQSHRRIDVAGFIVHNTPFKGAV